MALVAVGVTDSVPTRLLPIESSRVTAGLARRQPSRGRVAVPHCRSSVVLDSEGVDGEGGEERRKVAKSSKSCLGVAQPRAAQVGLLLAESCGQPVAVHLAMSTPSPSRRLIKSSTSECSPSSTAMPTRPTLPPCCHLVSPRQTSSEHLRPHKEASEFSER